MMQSNAPKRRGRKTSPSSSLPVDSKTPPNAPPTQQAQQLQSSPSRSIHRPSFASPTTSVLARRNPDALARVQEAATLGRRSSPDDVLPVSQPDIRDDIGAEVDTALTTQLEPSLERDGPTLPSAAVSSIVQARSNTDPTTAPSDLQRSPSRRVGGDIFHAQPPRRTLTRPQPRPLPPPGLDTEDDLLDTIGGRGQHRSPLLNTGILPIVVQPEPELPATPEHPDPVVSTPPSGIHNTPSKRRRGEGEKRKISPTRHPLSQELAPEQISERMREKSPDRPPPKNSKNPKRKRGVVTVAEAVSQVQPRPQAEGSPQAGPQTEFAPGTHPRRSIRLRGRDWDKRQQHDALMQQVTQLEADLEMATETNRAAASGESSRSDNEAILDFLRRHLLTDEKEPEPDPSVEWLETASDPIAMLGFNGCANSNLPTILPPQNVKETEQKPTSHHPIPMSASQELPFLQVFTPLTYKSTVVTIPASADEPDEPTFQKHTIHVQSDTPPGMFAACIEMVVNMRSLAIASLTVPRLDPAAITELQPFLDSITSTQNPYHPGLTRNINVACWALSEWYRVALKRANFWHALDKQLGPESDKSGLVELRHAFREQKKRRPRKKDADTESGGDADDALGGTNTLYISSAALLPHMGRTGMDLEVPVLAEDGAVSELRVTWQVEFDWTGTARNKMGVEVGVPGKCEITLKALAPPSYVAP